MWKKHHTHVCMHLSHSLLQPHHHLTDRLEQPRGCHIICVSTGCNSHPAVLLYVWGCGPKPAFAASTLRCTWSVAAPMGREAARARRRSPRQDERESVAAAVLQVVIGGLALQMPEKVMHIVLHDILMVHCIWRKSLELNISAIRLIRHVPRILVELFPRLKEK